MIRQLMIALGVIALGIGYQGVALALGCPEQPTQISKDFEGEVITAVAKIGPVSGGELKIKAKQTTRDLFEKAAEGDRVYLEQMMYATYCSSLQDNKTLSKSEISQKILDYNAGVRAATGAKQPTVVPPALKPPRKKKAGGPQSNVNPPVAPLPQAETGQPSAQKLQPAVLQSLSQNSAVNSSNIFGDHNSVVIVPPEDKPLGHLPSNIHDGKLYIECERKTITQRTMDDGKLKGLAFSHVTSATDTEFQSLRKYGGRTDWLIQGGAFVCQVTNYGTVPVLKVQITFGLRFLDTVWLDSKGSFTHRFKSLEQWPSQIRKLDPGSVEAFAFIIKNTTNDWLEVIVPEFVDLQVLGETKKRSVYLARPDDDPGHLGTYYRSVFPFPPADFAQQNRPENWPQSPPTDLQQ